MDPQTVGAIGTLIIWGALLFGTGVGALVGNTEVDKTERDFMGGLSTAGAILFLVGLLSLLIAHVRWS